jgi:hypothetical protein
MLAHPALVNRYRSPMLDVTYRALAEGLKTA